MSRVFSYSDDDKYMKTRAVLMQMGITNATALDCVNVRYICSCVSRRSAQLVGTAIAALLNRMQEPRVMVAVDGSVYRHHPTYRMLLFEQARKLTEQHIDFDFMLSSDGSGRGAALVAAVAVRESLRGSLKSLIGGRDVPIFPEGGSVSSYDSVLAPVPTDEPQPLIVFE